MTLITGKTELTNSQTGEMHVSNIFEGLEFNPFNWMEGNFSCDCNRHEQFMRAKTGTDDDFDIDCNCGEPVYRAKIYSAKGEVIYDDTQSFSKPFVVYED